MLSKHSLLRKKEEVRKIELDAPMLQVFKEAITNMNVIKTIYAVNNQVFHDMLIIEAYPDTLARSDKLKLDFYVENGMSKDADKLYQELSNLTYARMCDIATFLTQYFDLQIKDQPLVMRDGTDPRFGNNFYAPKHNRVAINIKFIDSLTLLIENTDNCDNESQPSHK
ncbi:hypothetical protein [Legionella pneumophila]|uniref:hypothetical protein n=1 Tax=Legionella pneumophila TaxID=446 RepID=UPI00399D317B